MTQIAYLSPIGPQPDRRTRLLVMGILLLGMAALSTLMLLFMGVAIAMTGSAGMPSATWRQMIPGMVIYLGIAVIFAWMGWGSIARKRWVRPAVLAIAWNWLIVGACGMVAAIYVVVNMQRVMTTAAVK